MAKETRKKREKEGERKNERKETKASRRFSIAPILYDFMYVTILPFEKNSVSIKKREK